MNGPPLKLSAQDADDLQIIAAVLQDAIVPVCDMLYTPAEKNFIMAVHRFRWDDVKFTEASCPPCFERVHCAVDIDGVENVQQHGFDKGPRCGMLDLLTLMLEKGDLKLVFAGGAEVRLKLAPGWRMRIKDFGDPWPSSCQPSHPA